MSNFTKDWQRIDTKALPETHIDYLELAQNNRQFQHARAEICKALGGSPGVGVDVGCGLGLAVHELTELGHRVTGIDLSQTMIDRACKRYPGLDFRVASVLNLPFENESLDFYRAERVYVHLPEAEQALKEAYRILKPGGRLVLAEPDLETMIFTCSDANRNLARMAVKAAVENHPNAHAGSYLRGQLIRTGFTNIDVVGFTHIFRELNLANPLAIDIALEAAFINGYLSTGQIEQLRQDLIEHADRDDFQFSCTAFIVSANKPGTAL